MQQTPVKFQNTGAFMTLSPPQKQEHPALEKFWTRAVCSLVLLSITIHFSLRISLENFTEDFSHRLVLQAVQQSSQLKTQGQEPKQQTRTLYFFCLRIRSRQKISWFLVQPISVYSGLNDCFFGLFSQLSFENKHYMKEKRLIGDFLDTPPSNNSTVVF